MSREELAEQFCTLTCPNPEDHCTQPWPCYDVAEEVERLLAAEREKVREMCIEAVMARWLVGSKAADAIRQLDLTKDLAPSTEEKKWPTK